MSNAYFENQARRKKDAAVARWMGWVGVGVRRRVVRGSTSDEERWEGLSSDTADALTEIPYYTRRWEDVHAMEAKIKSRDMLLDYSNRLAFSVTDEAFRSQYQAYGIIGACLLATPEQRVDALLSLILEQS